MLDLISDLHLECYDNCRKALRAIVPKLVSDDFGKRDLIIAGDFFNPGSRPSEFKLLLATLINEIGYRRIFYVAGNHEFYHSSLEEVHQVFSKLQSDKLIFLDLLSEPFQLDNGLNIFGRTLWSDFGGDGLIKLDIGRVISDYRLIDGLTTDKVEELFRQHDHDIAKNVNRTTILVTHFSPTRFKVNPIHKGSRFNCYFDVGVEDTIEMCEPFMVAHGHTHYAVDYRVPWKSGMSTRIVSAPYGYPNELERIGPYKPAKLL